MGSPDAASRRPNPFPCTEIRTHNGAPALFIEGEPTFPLFHMSWPCGEGHVAQIAERGLHLFTTDLAHGWTGVGAYDYAATDARMASLLSADPDMLFMPRVILSAPADWMDANPDDVVDYADPDAWTGGKGWGSVRNPSWASQRWLADASEALRRLIRHVAAQDYAGHVIAWHIGSGIYGEWHHWNAPSYPDTSPAFLAAYGRWLAERYPDDTPDPVLPTIEQRRQGWLGMFRDPAACRWMVDHAEFFHQLGADALSAFAQVVKEETEGRSPVLAFNGYLPDLDVNHEIDHRAFDRTLADDNVQCFASPHSYWRRRPGQDAMMRGFMGSVRMRGRLWFDEQDDRTCLAKPSQYTHAETVGESVEILWRGFAQALTHNCGLWFMDQHGGWYDDPAILDAFERMVNIGRESMQRPRERVSQVAVVSSLRSAFYVVDRLSGEDHVSQALMDPQLEQLALCGAPFDMYLTGDLLEPVMPDYCLYVFLDTFFMTDAELAAAVALRDAGKTLLFFYAPGFVSADGLSVARMRGLLGIDVLPTESVRLPGGETQRPGFQVPNTQPGEAVRVGNVCYCPAPPASARELRGVFRHCGVHVYLDTDDPLMVGGGYLAVHAAADGPKTIRNPAPVDWVDARTGEALARATNEITVEMLRGQTLLLSLDE